MCSCVCVFVWVDELMGYFMLVVCVFLCIFEWRNGWIFFIVCLNVCVFLSIFVWVDKMMDYFISRV